MPTHQPQPHPTCSLTPAGPWRAAPASLRRQLAAVAGAFIVLAAGCGGGSSDAPAESGTSIRRVHVVGDSLADVGTFGLKATIQSPGATLVSERLPVALGLPAGCPYYEASSNSFVPVGVGRCTQYAVGGTLINDAGLAALGEPRALSQQLRASTSLGNFNANDLLMVVAGGNDAAALTITWLRLQDDAGASYAALLRTLLSSGQVSAAFGGGVSGLEDAGVTYMQALADRLHSLVDQHALQRGAQRVVLLTMPNITHTPRVQALLDGYAQSLGGGTAGNAARVRATSTVGRWVDAFNTRLSQRMAGDARVAKADFHAALNAWIAEPARFGLSNVTTPACLVAANAEGSVTEVFAACTEAALAAAPPAGVTDPAWYQRWLFSDGFHPTPYGHALLHDVVWAAVGAAGWR